MCERSAHRVLGRRRSPRKIAFEDELTWTDPSRVRLATGYSQRLWQIVVLGTVGAVALFWVSALISQL